MMEGGAKNTEIKTADVKESKPAGPERNDITKIAGKMNELLFGNDRKSENQNDIVQSERILESKTEKNEKQDAGETFTEKLNLMKNDIREMLDRLFPDDRTAESVGDERSENNETDAKETETKEEKDLTSEEINELQIKAIKEAFERIARGEKLTNAEKGNLGEMLMDQYYISQGYKPIHKSRVTDLAHKSGQGIDGVYEKTNPDGTKSYIIADAKVNHSKLNEGLADGTDQMSKEWIEKRLDNSVGKEKADEIRDTYEDAPDSVSKEVYHFSYGDTEDGISSSNVTTVDDKGNLNKDKAVVQIFDEYGNEMTGGEQDD